MQTQHQASFADEEMGLIDIIRFLFKHRLWMAFCITTAVLGATAYLYFKPLAYEASASIQVAKVAGEEVETTAVLNEKIKLPLYFSDSTLQACHNESTPAPSGGLAGLLTTKTSKNSPFLNLSVRMASPEKAKECILQVVSDIQSHQALLTKPLIQKQQSLRNALLSKINVAEEITQFLSTQLASRSVSNERFAAAAMLLATSTSKDHEIKDLRAQLMDLENEMSPHQTSEAILAAPIATNIAAETKPWLVVLLAALAGFFMGALLGALKSWLIASWPALKKQAKT
jgi:ElaB/YqjD/DUF883 family membrane-anchored ribosome-binding protein